MYFVTFIFGYDIIFSDVPFSNLETVHELFHSCCRENPDSYIEVFATVTGDLGSDICVLSLSQEGSYS